MAIPSSNWDVVVVGGGSAGIAAAISASRAGPEQKVLLLESSDVLGGNSTQAFVHTICGLYLPPPSGAGSDHLEFANPGFASRMVTWLLAEGGAHAPEIHGKVGVLPTIPERLAHLLQTLCSSIPNLTVSFNSYLEKVETAPDGFICHVKNVNSALCDEAPRHPHHVGWVQRHASWVQHHAGFLIDTSGDAAAAAGVEALTDTPSASEVQHPTYIFRVSGANQTDLKGFNRLKLGLAFTKASQSGRLPTGASSVLVRPATTAGEAYVSVNMPKPEDSLYDPLDVKCMAHLSETARSWAEKLVQFLRDEMPGWADCQVVEWPRKMGVRETRRVRGRYVMTAEDVLEGKIRPDEVAKSTWPVELWNHHTGAQFSYPKGPCSIPLDALISASNSRLGMAGRCMSGTHEALGALRVIGTALATGEAIGLAAAWAVQHNCNLEQVSAKTIEELRHTFHQLKLP